MKNMEDVKRVKHEEYLKHRDGYLRRAKEYADNNRKKVREYQKEYRSRPEVKKSRMLFLRSQRIVHKLKFRARDLLNKAVAKGIIIKKPCLVCGKLKVEAHHKNYNHPLKVIWLCRLHHEHEHGRMLWKK